jgi:hypothetical protein
LNNRLIGGNGNDTYQFDDGWGKDTVVELPSQGIDTMDFSSVSNANLTFSVAAALSVTDGTNDASHSGQAVESLIGGSAGDIFQVRPSATTAFSFEGGADATDILNFDAIGRSVTRTTTTIIASGLQPVTHSGFEQVNVLNTAPTILRSDDLERRFLKQLPPRLHLHLPMISSSERLDSVQPLRERLLAEPSALTTIPQ